MDGAGGWGKRSIDKAPKIRYFEDNGMQIRSREDIGNALGKSWAGVFEMHSNDDPMPGESIGPFEEDDKVRLIDAQHLHESTIPSFKRGKSGDQAGVVAEFTRYFSIVLCHHVAGLMRKRVTHGLVSLAPVPHDLDDDRIWESAIIT